MAIPVTTENEVIIGKSSRSEVCGMEMNASVVKAVTSTLYNHKKEAVVREYATNITDSHNDSGNRGLKGYVHVPTKMHPFIEFHDKGLGMSEDTIYNVFTVLGKSTKRGDNTTNGSLGFGSKSYGTVCDQMTVTSVKDGIKCVVVCYKDRTGMLAADTKSLTETNEPNGTIVSIPVKISEVASWQETAARVLGAFDVQHEVNTFGDYQSLYEEMVTLCKEVRQKGTVFSHNFSNVMHQMRSSKCVLMGDVIYTLPDFNTLLPNLKIRNSLESVANSSFLMTHFNIGDLDHAPSRESISYDDVTFRKVKHRVSKITLMEIRKLEEQLGDVSNISYYKFRKQFQDTPVYNFLSKTPMPFLKGETLFRCCPSIGGRRWIKKITLLGDDNKFGRIRGNVVSACGNYGVFSSIVNSFDQARLFDIKNPLILFSEKEKGIFKLKDTLNKAQSETGRQFILVVDTKAQAENVYAWFGEGEVECGDKYSPEKNSRTKGNKSKRSSYGIKEDWETVGKVYTINENGYSSTTKKVDLTQDGVYFMDSDELIRVNGFVKGKESKYSMNYNLANLLNTLEVKQVVVKNKNNQGKINRSGVKPVGSVLKERLKDYKKSIIKTSIWKNGKRLTPDYDKPLLVKSKTYSKVKTIVNSKEDAVVEKACDVSLFGLDSTPAYRKEVERFNLLTSKVSEEVESLKEKLPLWKHIRNKDEDAVVHYLKLEKVIK